MIGYAINPLHIYLDGTKFDQLPEYYSGSYGIYNAALDLSSKMTEYSYLSKFNITTGGSHTLSLISAAGIYERDISLANILFVPNSSFVKPKIAGGVMITASIPIVNTNMTDSVNQGTGLFWKTNSWQRSDIINYPGNGMGGFDFWTAYSTQAPKKTIKTSDVKM